MYRPSLCIRYCVVALALLSLAALGCKEKKRTEIQILTNVKGVNVFVGGTYKGVLQHTRHAMPMKPGSHELSFQKTGYENVNKKVFLTPNMRLPIVINLKRIQKNAPPRTGHTTRQAPAPTARPTAPTPPAKTGTAQVPSAQPGTRPAAPAPTSQPTKTAPSQALPTRPTPTSKSASKPAK